MKRIIFKIFLLLAFILNFTILAGFCETLEINSVTYDNSGAVLSINSFDTFDYQTKVKPIVRFLPEEQKLYFDLQPAKLKGSNKDYVINSDGIEEISIAQFSQNPETVRIVVKHNDKFNPANICIKRINNTFFVRFKQTVISNYYFQEVYKESGTQEIYESTTINQKIAGASTNTFNQINSAFNNNSLEDGDVILTPKNQILKTKYYIDNISFRGAMPVISGAGAYTLSKPMYLASPSRVAFDIKNAVVNPVYRNKDIPFGTNDSIKIGQFNQNTARIVITTPNPENYIPVLYGDAQRLALYNPKTTSALNLYSSTTNMTAVNSEKIDGQTFGAKLVFNSPLIFGIDKTQQNKLVLNLYNVNNYFSGAIKTELRGTPFESLEMTDLKGGGAKFTLPLNDIDHSDIYIGGDGKTLRIRVHTTSAYIPKEEPITEIQTPKIVIPAIVKPRKDNKKYVILDAGHGGSDCGAIRDNINEKDIVLDITKRVEKMLKKKGYVVAMTRETDKYVSLEERVEMSEVFNPDIFISIHVNSSNSDSPYGIETHYYKDNSLSLAKNMHAAMLNNINSKDRGLFKSKFYVINHTTAPAVLLEVGFLSNPQERAQLITESRKNATAKAIVEGIDAYFK